MTKIVYLVVLCVVGGACFLLGERSGEEKWIKTNWDISARRALNDGSLRLSTLSDLRDQNIEKTILRLEGLLGVDEASIELYFDEQELLSREVIEYKEEFEIALQEYRNRDDVD
ncbi:MAG: hypothetical protein AAF402_06325 [Pseudomonadota bacterium]